MGRGIEDILSELNGFYTDEQLSLLKDIVRATWYKIDYFAKFKDIFEKVQDKKDQWKNEKWYVAELAFYLNKKGYYITPEYSVSDRKHIDLHISKNGSKFELEIKERFNVKGNGGNRKYWDCYTDNGKQKNNNKKQKNELLDDLFKFSVNVNAKRIFIAIYRHEKSEPNFFKKIIPLDGESLSFAALNIVKINENANLFLHIWTYGDDFNVVEKNQSSNACQECNEIIKYFQDENNISLIQKIIKGYKTNGR